MHTHHGTLRLLIKIVSILLVGIAAYLLIFHGIAGGSTIATSTPSAATSTTATTTVPAATTTAPVATPTTTPTTPPPVTVTPLPPTTPAPTVVTVTNADNGKTIYLQKGQVVTIDFGSTMHWSYSFDPEGIVTASGSTEAGSAGTYRAASSGTTSLHATGSPICKPDQACPMYVAVSTVTLIVQ